MQRKDIQLEVIREITASSYVPGNRKPGDYVWVTTEAAARALVEAGLCRLPKAEDPPQTAARPVRRSASWPVDRFSVIDKVWRGETVVCIGGGPSLTEHDLQLIRGRARVIAVNDNYLVAPWADLCYFADARWWTWHTEGLPKAWPWMRFTKDEVRDAFKRFAGQKVSIGGTGMMTADPNVHMIKNGGRDGLSDEPNTIRTGSNGGYQAVNVATLTAPRRILLVAYDMRYPGGRSHAHNGHPVKMPERVYTEYARNFATMLPDLKRLGIEVINCTPGSAISCFPRADLASALT